MPNTLKTIAEFLALRRNTVLLLGALVLAGTGEKLWLGFTPEYLLVLGAGTFIVGLFDALQTLLGAVYAYPGGWLTDRWGQRRSLMFFSALSIAGYLLVLLWHHWLALVIGAFFFLAWSALSLPATFTVVATSLGANQYTMGIGVQSMVRRVPMMIGPLIGGALITHLGWQRGIQWALALCILLGLATAAVQYFMSDPISLAPSDAVKGSASSSLSPSDGERAGVKGSAASLAPSDGERAGVRGSASSLAPSDGERAGVRGSPPAQNFAAVCRSFTPTLRELLVSDILIRFCERIPYAFLIIWAINYVKLTPQQWGYLVAIEMVTAMLCYIPVAHLADRYGRRPFVLITFVFFTLFPVTLLWATNFAWLALAFAVRGLKEFGEPARKAIILGEARPEIRSRTYGAYYLIRDTIVTTGSFLGWALWKLGPRWNFTGAAVLGALGTIWFWWFIYRQKRITH